MGATQKAAAASAASSLAATTTTSPSSSGGGTLYDDLIAAKNRTSGKGDRVLITGLAKAPQYNDLEGRVTTSLQDTGRYGVKVVVLHQPSDTESPPTKKTKTL